MTTRSGRTRQVILGFLLGGPKSGYTIKKIVEESIAHFWTESFGQIYPVLRELTEDGLIEPISSDTEGGRPSKMFALTEEGRAELTDWLAAPPRTRPPRNELLLKLFFLPRVAPESAVEHVARFRQETETELRRYNRIEQWLTQEHGNDPEYRFWLVTLRFGMREAEAHLTWCDEAMDLLGGRTPE